MIKYLFVLVLMILGFNAMAQEPSYTPMRNNYLFRGVRIDSLFLIPHFSDTTTANVNLNSINGNLIRIDSLVYMRWNGAWISLASGGGGSQSLQDVTDVGDSTTNNITLLNSGIILDNNSRLQKGTIDAGYGGNNGIALICGLGYEMKWEAGRLYIMNGNGNAIRETRYNFTDTPTVADDITKGYYSGSRWILDNGTLYTCSDNTTNNAVWSITKDAYVDSIYRTPGVDSFYYTKQGITYSVKDSVGSTDTTSLSNRINLKLSITDTSGMLSTYAKTSAVNLKVNISDTSSMLSPYAKTSAVNLKVNISDTASMLSPYAKTSAVNLKVNISDTATMLSPYAKTSAVNLKVNISDTSNMLSTYLRKNDTASLSTRIDAKQNTLTNPVTGTGTTGAISKFTGASTIGDATVDVDYLQQDMSMVAMQAMGSSIKGYNLTVPMLSLINTSYTGITSGSFLLYPIYIPKTTTITGVRWFQTVAGVYTANNYNGVALYSVSGGTLTRVDSSANDGTIWKATANTWGSKAFSSTYSAAAGIYYVGMVYSSSAQTTAPSFGATTVGQNAITKSFDFTNSLKLSLFQSAVTTLPSTITASATSATSNNVALYLY